MNYFSITLNQNNTRREGATIVYPQQLFERINGKFACVQITHAKPAVETTPIGHLFTEFTNNKLSNANTQLCKTFIWDKHEPLTKDIELVYFPIHQNKNEWRFTFREETMQFPVEIEDDFLIEVVVKDTL